MVLLHLPGRIRNVDRMVGNPLKIADTVQKNGKRPAVVLGQITVIQLYQISAQHVLIMVHILLHMNDFFHVIFTIRF